MKRALALFLVIIMCISICSCVSKKDLLNDEELVSQLCSKIGEKESEDLVDQYVMFHFVYKVMYGGSETSLKSIEEKKSGSYSVIGELQIDWQDELTGENSEEYVPFTADFSTDENGEISCDSWELETSDDSLLSDAYTDKKIERRAFLKVYDEVDSKFKTADASSSKFNINKIERDGDEVFVYGTVVLYDKYGRLTTGWRDGSGSSSHSFKVRMSSLGSILSCNLE